MRDILDVYQRWLLRLLGVAAVFLLAWTGMFCLFFIAHTLLWLLGGAPRPPWEVMLG